MDFSRFSADDFNAKDWINNALNPTTELETTPDQHATTLVMKLQMFIQEVNNMIEDASNQAVQSLPRMLREVEAVRQESALLREQMLLARQDVQRVEQETAASMQSLMQLDKLKSRMRAASDALKEADNWTSLAADMDEVFQKQSSRFVATRLVAMQQSLQMLTEVTDYADRVSLLEQLRNRLETQVTPSAVAAFNSQDQVAAKEVVEIFADIDRLSELHKIYSACQKTELQAQWSRIVDDEPDQSLLDQVSRFYDILLETWHDQLVWCAHIFPDPVPTLCQLLSETLSSLDPPISRELEEMLSELSELESLQTLVRFKKSTEHFTQSIETSCDASAAAEALHWLRRTSLAPLRPHIKNYAKLERAVLLRELESVRLDEAEVVDCVQLLSDSVPQVFTLARQAQTRCKQLTEGFGSVQLVSAVKSLLSSYSSEVSRVLTNIREKLEARGAQWEGDEDWAGFQHTLAIIGTCGQQLNELDDLDGGLCSEMTSLLNKTSSSTQTSREHFQQMAELYLNEEQQRHKLWDLASSLHSGESGGVLEETRQQLVSVCREAQRVSLSLALSPVRRLLEPLSSLPVWSEDTDLPEAVNLPTFSRSPQQYITKVGQYLMTLPQHLEPFTLEESPALLAAVRHGQLPHISATTAAESVADQWLESVASGAMEHFAERILLIPQLTASACKQLVTDIDYVLSVAQDLGLRESSPLQHLRVLLDACDEDALLDAAEDISASLVNNVRRLRGFTV